METIYYYIMLAICGNGAIAMVNGALGGPIPTPCWGLEGQQAKCGTEGLQDFIITAETETETASNSTGLETTFTFGNYIPVTQLILNLITFQYFLAVLQVLPFPSDFILVVQAFLGLVAVFTIAYMISNRSTKQGV